MTEGVKRSVLSKAMRLTTIWEGIISDMEKLLMTLIEDQTQKCVPLNIRVLMAKGKRLFVILKKRLNLTTVWNLLLALGGLNDSRIVAHYIM